MKLSSLIGKKVQILDYDEDSDYYYEFELGIKYDRIYWDTEKGKYVGIVCDVSCGRSICIVVSSGEFLWDFDDDELMYRGKLVMDTVTEWDYKNCKSLVKKDEKWGIDIGREEK